MTDRKTEPLATVGTSGSDVPPRSPVRPVPRVLLAVLLGLLVEIGVGVVLSASLALFPQGRSGPAWVLAALNHVPMLLVSLLLIAALSRGDFGRYGFRMPREERRRWLPAATGWAALLSVTAFAIEKLGKLQGLPFVEGYSLAETVALIWLLASVAEEVLTRGLIQGFLAPLSSRGVRIANVWFSLPVLTAALFFAAMHLLLFTMGIEASTVLSIVGFALGVGLAAGIYRERTGSLLPAIAVHCTANAVGTILGKLAGEWHP